MRKGYVLCALMKTISLKRNKEQEVYKIEIPARTPGWCFRLGRHELMAPQSEGCLILHYGRLSGEVYQIIAQRSTHVLFCRVDNHFQIGHNEACRLVVFIVVLRLALNP